MRPRTITVAVAALTETLARTQAELELMCGWRRAPGFTADDQARWDFLGAREAALLRDGGSVAS